MAVDDDGGGAGAITVGPPRSRYGDRGMDISASEEDPRLEKGLAGAAVSSATTESVCSAIRYNAVGCGAVQSARCGVVW